MKYKVINILFFIGAVFALTGCKVKEYIEVPVEVEKVKIEYVNKLDSIYLHDSIATYVIQKGDTVFIDRYKYKVKEVYKTDTIVKVDSIPKVVVFDKIVEVNKLYSWLKTLMYIGGVGLIGLLIFLLFKFNLWKLLF